MRLIGLTQGRFVPSTRFRWSQYVIPFKEAGIDVYESDSRFGAYAPDRIFDRPFWLCRSLCENFWRTINSNDFDLRFLQRNFTNTLVTWEPFLKKPFVFDVDDAIFLGKRGESANKIASYSSVVVCGNDFLANHFEKYAPVTVVPTSVDTDYFFPRSDFSFSDNIIIGWSGTSSGHKYLYAIEDALRELLIRFKHATIKIVSDKIPMFQSIPHDRFVFEKWSPEREVEVLQEFTVGIMPLEDNLWERGKCSFKMLTYMAVGIPVVVSPVGMNAEVLSKGAVGFPAKTKDDWVESISMILSNPSLAKKMGNVGREVILNNYATIALAGKMCEIFKSVV